MSTIRAYWRKNVKIYENGVASARPVTCKDGFSMSVQASEFHYCIPRKTLKTGAYSAWEVGFPSKKEKALMPYCEDPGKPTDTVYGRVPTEVIDAIIKRHGGLE